MSGKSLKELLLKNVELADSSIHHDDENQIINNIFRARDTLNANYQYDCVKECIKNILGKYDNMNELLLDIAVKFDDDCNTEEAIFLYRLSFIISPNAKAANNIAILYAESNRQKYAIEMLKEASTVFPNDPTITENLNILLNN